MARPIANAGAWPAARPFTDLPVASQALSFSGTPGTGGTSITHYRSWVADRPDGSSAALSNSGIAAPNLLTIDTPGSVLVFVQVADNRFNDALANPWTHADNANYVSEADPRAAPDSAFVVVSVKTENLDVEIPAAFQRNWRAKFAAFVDAVDTASASPGAHNIADHDTTATGAELNTLTGGASTDASTLHTHTFDTINERTADMGVTVDGVKLKDGYPYVRAGGSGSQVWPVAVLDAQWVGLATTVGTLQLRATLIFQSQTFAETGILKGAVAFKTAANANNKRMVLDCEGTHIFDQTVASNDGLFIIFFVIVRTGAGTQRAYVWGNGPVAFAPSETLLTLTEASLNRLFVRCETANIGDITVLWTNCDGSFTL